MFVNPAAVRIFGASSADEVLGRSPFDFFHIDQHLHLRDRVSKTARRRHRAGERRARRGTQWRRHRGRSRLHPVRGFARPRNRVGDARHHRAQARRGGAARERRAADARLRRRAGRRLGLEPRNRRGRVLGALEADARLRRRGDRAARPRLGTPAASRRPAARAAC